MKVKYDFTRNDIMSIIHRRLDQLRMTQKDLADKVGTTEATISRYMYKRRKPSFEMVVKILYALDMEILIGEVKYISPSLEDEYGKR